MISKPEKNFSLKERTAHFLSLTQYSLGVEFKFVECVNFCCWAWLKYAVTLKENPLNVTWFWWAWLKSLLTLIKNLLNVKTILLLEFCTIWISIHVNGKTHSTRLPSRKLNYSYTLISYFQSEFRKFIHEKYVPNFGTKYSLRVTERLYVHMNLETLRFEDDFVVEI